MNESYLVHHGILGMKWGVRRFQNEDGSLTSEGRRRYKYDVEGSKNKYILAKNSYNKEKSVNKIKMDLAKDEYVNNKVKQLSSKTIGRDLAASLGIISGRNAAKIGAVIGSAKVAQNARSNYNRDSRLNAEALAYRREHRNTRMTLEQIRRMLEENRYAK